MVLQLGTNSVRSITKADVPHFATSTGSLGLIAFASVSLIALLMKARICPGVLEASIGIVFGVPAGLLTAFGWRNRAIRGAIANQNRSGPKPLFQFVEPAWGSDIALSLLGLLVVAGAAAAFYALFREMPTLGMPWARFAYAIRFNSPSGMSLTLPGESLVATVVSFMFVTYLVAAIYMLLWYLGLPPRRMRDSSSMPRNETSNG
jgi:hypothetical protein